MKSNRFNKAQEEEKVLLSANRRMFPAIDVIYVREEGWDKGRIYIVISRDSECMTIEQFELFIAMFSKLVEIARRKEQELDAVTDEYPCVGELPQVELNFNSSCPELTYYTVNDLGGHFGCKKAEMFIPVLEKLLAEGKRLTSISVNQGSAGAII